jgi:N-acetyl-anhydromuramyl-L-alanine amidase AmpD
MTSLNPNEANHPNRIIIHHTADSSNEDQSAIVDRFHKSKGFPQSLLGYYGGYHYLIEKDGDIFQYRLETEIGAHDAGENYNSIGIALAGNFNYELPSTAQEIALAQLLDQIIKRWNIPLDRIEPHRWGDTTDCPGTKLADRWAQIIYLKRQLSLLQKILLWLTNSIKPT